MHEKRKRHSLNFFDSRTLTKEPPKPGKRLELFVDINDTIIVTDSGKGIDKKTAVLLLLAEKYSAVWDAAITQEKMIFKDFVRKHICPDDARGRITQYIHFRDYLKNKGHIEILKKVEVEYEEIMSKFEKNGLDNDIFPSFIKLIHNLEENKHKIPYTLILRTLGHDLQRTVRELERRTPIKFVSYAKFDNDGYLVIDGENKCKKTWEEIHSAIKTFEHGAWLDNYERWKANKFITGGKIFPLDIHDENLVSVFWDDNVGDKKRNIISIQLPSGEEITDYKKFEKELIKLGYLVPIQTLEAIKDDNYFIKLKNYSYYWSSLKELRFSQNRLALKEKSKLFLLGMFFDQGSNLNRDLTQKMPMEYSKEIAESIMRKFNK